MPRSFGVLGVEPQHPVVPVADLDAMVGDVVEERALAVALGVEADTSSAASEAAADSCLNSGECGPSHDGSYLTIGGRSGSLKRLRLLHSNSSLPDWVCRPLQIFLVVRRQRLRLRHVLLAALAEPAERHRRAKLLLLGRHDVVAALEELLERDHLLQVGGEIDALDPVDLVDALGEIVRQAEPLADLVEDPVVGLRSRRAA